MGMTQNGINIFKGRRRRTAFLYYGPDLGDCGCNGSSAKYETPVAGEWYSIGTLQADQYPEEIIVKKLRGLGVGGEVSFGLRFRDATLNQHLAPQITDFLAIVTTDTDVDNKDILVISPVIKVLDTTSNKKHIDGRSNTIGETVEWLKTVKSEWFDKETYSTKYSAFDLCFKLAGTTIPSDYEIVAMYNYSIL